MVKSAHHVCSSSNARCFFVVVLFGFEKERAFEVTTNADKNSRMVGDPLPKGIVV